MSKKVLDTKTIINELKGQSVYFQKDPEDDVSPSSKPEAEIHHDEETEPVIPSHEPKMESNDSVSKTESNPDSLKKDRKDANLSTLADMRDSMLASNQDDIVETIRKTVKQVGAKTLYIRLTSEEKQELASIVFGFNEVYSGEGRKTSENEIGRIALNFLIEDYRARGKESMLAKVIAALFA
jgi:hypothetical protein